MADYDTTSLCDDGAAALVIAELDPLEPDGLLSSAVSEWINARLFGDVTQNIVPPGQFILSRALDSTVPEPWAARVTWYKMRGRNGSGVYDTWLSQHAPDYAASKYAGALSPKPTIDVTVIGSWCFDG